MMKKKLNLMSAIQIYRIFLMNINYMNIIFVESYDSGDK
jgi:hypothetical protein